MRPWLRAPATLPGFPRVTAMAVAREGDAAGSSRGRPRTVAFHPALQARHLERLTQRAHSPYVLVHPAGAAPSSDWLGGALALLDAAPALAAVSVGGSGREPLPTLCLDSSTMLARRSALLHSGGLAPGLQGQGDGLDLAWRLWAMGQQVVSLPGEGRADPARPAHCPCSVYQAYWSWLQILVRNCEEEVLGRAFSAAVLRLVAEAGEAADRTAVPSGEVRQPAAPAAPPAAWAIQEFAYLRRNPASLHEPRHRVSHGVGEMLVALHDATMLLPAVFDERKQVQALRRVRDAEIEAQLGRPPLEIVEAQMAALGRSALRAGMAAGSDQDTGPSKG